MPRVPDAYSPYAVTCEGCTEQSDEWVEIEITNISSDKPAAVSRKFCLGCAYILSNKLGIDLDEGQEGYFRINEFGQFETFVKDCN